MSNYIEIIDLNLAAISEAGKARQQVLTSIPWQPAPTTNVAYVSSNRVLIIGTLEQCQAIEQRLGEQISCYLAIQADKPSASLVSNGWNINTIKLTGFLGRFEAFLEDITPNTADPDHNNLGKILGIQNGLFDHVIDCNEQVLITAAIKPSGYYHVAGNASKLDEAIEQIPDMVGEFDKPKFFDYNPDICAHGRSSIPGCTRCIDACPTDAISSIGELIEVNTHLCQGGGACTTSCPSGAITYRYPTSEHMIEFVRQVVRDLRVTTNNQGVAMLMYDNEHGADALREKLSTLPEHIIPIAVEEIGAIGLDLIAAAMTYGVDQLFIYTPPTVAHQVQEAIQRDVRLLTGIFNDLALPQFKLQQIETLDLVISNRPTTGMIDNVATFAGIGNKRSIIRSALQHFNQLAAESYATLPLPEGSIFGTVNLNDEACTLCMACVSVCPGSALEAGGETPALKFIESNCLQCGICTRACPESALTLTPRFNFDTVSVNRNQVLKEEEPFRCLSCNKPFATHAMINRMTEQLSTHSMFAKPEALNRLRMCGDCRVVDMFDKGDTVG